MATRQLRQDSSNNRLVLASSGHSQIRLALFSLVWLSVNAFMIYSAMAQTRINLNLLFFAVILAIPLFFMLASFMFPRDIVIDRSSGTLIQRRLFFFIPLSISVVPFSEIANVEMQIVPRLNTSQSNQTWAIYAVLRASKRVAMNWGDQANECEPMARTLADFMGVRVVSSQPSMPAWLKQLVPELNNAINDPTPHTWVESAQSPDVKPGNDALGADTSIAVPVAQANQDLFPSANAHPLTSRDLEQRVTHDATDSQSRFVLARKYHASGQLERAIELYGATLKLDTTNPAAQNDLGVALQQRGKRANAEDAFRRAIALDPFLFVAHLNLGLLLRSMNRAVDASREFYLARQNARSDAETRLAESASTGAKVEFQLSKV